MQNKVFLGIGSNLGNRADNIEQALLLLKNDSKIKVLKISQIYETAPMGGPLQEKYLNAAAGIATEYNPEQLLDCLRIIEQKLGREKQRFKNQPRTIDLDILFFNDLVLNKERLTIPHPLITERWFVLKPLCDIAGDFIHPLLNKNIKALLNDLDDHPGN